MKFYTGIILTLMLVGVYVVASSEETKGSTFLQQNESIRDFENDSGSSRSSGSIINKFLKIEGGDSNIESPDSSTPAIPKNNLRAMYNVFDLQSKIKHLDM